MKILLFLMSLFGFCLSDAETPQDAASPASTDKPAFKQEELDQLLASIALHPDDLLSQILMASTYPVEVVQADRWAKANSSLAGDALGKELEKQTWDPSVKSLVNFPQVLSMMSEKLDWTVNVGNAFLSQQKQVMETIQKLRAKAKEAGNLESGKEQAVTTTEEGGTTVIVIESSNPDVIYVPTYNPTIVYGSWWYPAYPPYYWYPPAYVPHPGLYYGTGVAIGFAWGYAWGHCGWHDCSVDIDVNRNVDRNRNIDRGKYATQYDRNGQAGGRGEWKHDPSHRKGTAYRDAATSRKFGGATSAEASKAREAFRGRADAGRADLGRADTGRADPGRADTGRADPGRADTGRTDLGRTNTGRADTSRPDPGAAAKARSTSSSRPAAFSGAKSSGASTRAASARGSSSRASSSGGRASRGGGRRG